MLGKRVIIDPLSASFWKLYSITTTFIHILVFIFTILQPTVQFRAHFCFPARLPQRTSYLLSVNLLRLESRFNCYPTITSSHGYSGVEDFAEEFKRERDKMKRPDGPRATIIGEDGGPSQPFPLRLGGKVVSGFGRGSKEVGVLFLYFIE